MGSDDKKSAPRLRNDSKPVALVEKFITTHKAIVAAVALIIVGATFATMLSAYASSDDVDVLHTRDAQMQREIQELRETDAEIRSALSAIKETTGNTRDDVKSLLQHVLANPVNNE